MTAGGAVLVAVMALSTSVGVAPSGAQAVVGPVVGPVVSGAADEVVVDRDETGRVVGVRSESGTALRRAPANATPRSAALRHLDRYAPAFGVDSSDLVVSRVVPSAVGGSVVRLSQHAGDLPVLGGEMVMSLDAQGGLLSVQGHVADTTAPDRGSVTATQAVRVATASVAKRHGRQAAGLDAALRGEWLFEPDLLGVPDDLGARRVWRVEVTDQAAVRETVLVDAATARVVWRVDEVKEATNRQICDNKNRRQAVGDCASLSTPARTETGPPSSVEDVNDAFELIGATAGMYADVAGLDLTELLGSTGGGSAKKLTAWVRYCEPVTVDSTCPLPNAFWTGSSMHFGQGFAGADDVVGHELTHGVIERFSDLFYFHQSGAINESLADVMGEILDHRNPSPGDTAGDWRLGEDLPGGALRDMADPTAFGQPDRMGSPLYEPDPTASDNGGVHTNSGVGNKAAQLISQGGTFNGVTVSGIDDADPTLAKTATLYAGVIQRLTSSSTYADLGRTLEQTCAELAEAGTQGFTSEDCDGVAAAVQATELLEDPTVPGAAPAVDAPDTCPQGTRTSLFTNEGSMQGLTTTATTLWTTAPNTAWGVARNARTGPSSLFAFDPDPGGYGDPSSSYVQTTKAMTLPAGRSAYLHFDQWRLFEWYDGPSPDYYDGGQVSVYASPDPAGPLLLQKLPASAWVNGPEHTLATSGSAAPVRVFGGDSHGWTSSRLDLSSLAGQTVRVRWTVRGDASVSMVGWYLDNPHVYSCQTPFAPNPVGSFRTQPLSGTKVRLTWTRPSSGGEGLTGFVVTRSDGVRYQLPAGARTLTTGTLRTRTNYTFTIQPLGAGGVAGTPTSVTVRAPAISLAAPAVVRAGARVTFTGKAVAVGTRTPPAGRKVVLQWRRAGSATWHTRLPNGRVAETRVGSTGSFRIVTAPRSTLYYRVAVSGSSTWFSGTSSAVRVRTR